MKRRNVNVVVKPGINYAASKTSATANSASSPNQLAEGAIGFYGTDPDTGNSNLIVDGDNDATGSLYYDRIQVFLGQKDGAKQVGVLEPTLVRYKNEDKASPVKQVSFIGCYGSAGTANVTSIAAGDVFTIGVLETTPGTNTLPRLTIAHEANAVDTLFDVFSKIAIENYERQLGSPEVKVKIEVVSNGTFTAADNNLTVTEGSKVVTFATAAEYDTGTPFAVGDKIRIGGTTGENPVYEIKAIDSLDITLDRPYTGATGTVSAANVGHIASATDFGVKITALEYGEHFRVYRDDSLENATILQPEDGSPAVAFDPGAGYGPDVAEAEKDSLEAFGNFNRNQAYRPQMALFTDESLEYNQLIIDHDKKQAAKHGMDAYNWDARRLVIFLADDTVANGGSNQVRTALNNILAAID